MSEVERRIRERSYQLWEQAGCPHGRSDEFWFIASQEIHAEVALDESSAGAPLPPTRSVAARLQAKRPQAKVAKAKLGKPKLGKPERLKPKLGKAKPAAVAAKNVVVVSAATPVRPSRLKQAKPKLSKPQRPKPAPRQARAGLMRRPRLGTAGATAAAPG